MKQSIFLKDVVQFRENISDLANIGLCNCYMCRDEVYDAYLTANKILDLFPSVEKSEYNYTQLGVFLIAPEVCYPKYMPIWEVAKLSGLLVLAVDYFTDKELRMYQWAIVRTRQFYESMVCQGVIDANMLIALQNSSLVTNIPVEEYDGIVMN